MNKFKNRFHLVPGFVISKILNWIPSFRIVNLILRIFGIKINNGVTIHNNVRFLVIKNITIGSNTTINSNTLLDSRGGIIIGSNTMIGSNSKIYTNGHDVDDLNFKTTTKSVNIGDNVVIFPNVIIMPGVTINNNSVILPGSIVIKNVMEYCVYGGVPARYIRHREKKNYKYSFEYKTYFGI